MSTTIDERVVEMRFDNKHFEDNVQTSLKSINQLKDSLDMQGATKGLEGIDRAAKNVNMGALGSAVETVSAKFSALQVMAITTLANITNSAVNAGKRMIAALTIDPIKTGLQEYETQINAVQTILANTESKGTTIDQVNKALDELNTYADKTIYNFTEMTRNIGTFTAAGVDLDTSVTAIQGIANLAAVSGSTSQQASTAMYQLSQALSTGTVRLMDWNSVVNAGMGGQVFQDALKETARAHGIAIDDIIEANGSFRESLQEGWLSADILTETLQHFTMAAEEGSDQWKAFRKQLMDSGYTEQQAEAILKLSNTATDAATKVKTFTQLWDTLKETAQSGWSQTWEIIFGDFEEAKVFFSDLYNFLAPLIEQSSKARNDLLQGWKDEGGRQHLIDSLYNTFEAIKSVIVPIKEAFREIFPPMTVKNLLAVTEGLKNFTASLKLGETASKNLKRTFKGVFATLDIVGQLLSAVLKAILPIFKGFGDLGGGILKLTAAWGDWMVQLSETIRKTDIFNRTLGGISNIVISIISTFQKFIGLLKGKIVSPGIEVLKDIFGYIRDRVFGVTDAVGDMKDGIVSSFDSMGNAIEQSSIAKFVTKLWELLLVVGRGAVKIFGGIASGLIEVFNNSNFEGLFDFINSLSLSTITIFAAKFVKGFADMTGSFTDFKDGVLDILVSVKDCFAAYQTQLKAGTLMKIAQAIAILAAAILVISLIDSDKLAGALGALIVLSANLMAVMTVFGKLAGGLGDTAKALVGMIGISTAILILAFALKTLEGLSWGDIAKGVVAIAAFSSILVGAAKLLNVGGKSMIKGATRMIIFAAAIAILAAVCKSFSSMKWEDIVKGLIAVAGLSSVMVGTAKLLNLGGSSMIKGATRMIMFGAAIAILASVCKSMSTLKWGELVKGLVAVAALSSVMVGTAKLLNLGGVSAIKGAGQMILFAAAIKILASACEDFGTMKWGDIAKGLVAIAALSSMLVGTVKLLGLGGSSGLQLMGIAVGLIAAAAALVIMSSALQTMGGMSWNEIAKGLIALGASMLILVMGLNAMQSAFAGAGVLFVAATAIAIFAPALAKLGEMSVGEIAKSLITLAAAFAILGVAGYLLAPLVGPILGISAALLLAGVGIAAVGAGITLLSIGLTALATTIATSSTAVAAGLTVIVTTLVELIPFIATKIGEGIIALCTVITEGAPAIAEALMSITVSLCGLLVESVPIITDTLLQVVISLLNALVEYTPQIVAGVFRFLIAILDGVADNLPALIQAAVDVLMAFFAGVIQALSGIDTDTLIQGIAGVGLLSGLMLALAAVSALIPAAMVGVLGMGVVIAELALILAAVGALAQIPGLDWLISEGGDFLQTIGTAIGKFIGGIAGGIASGFTSSLPEVGTNLSNFMKNLQPFIEGAKAIDPAALEGVKTLTGVILAITAANILDGIASFITGEASVEKFANELPLLGQGLKGFSDAVTGIVPGNVIVAAEAAKYLAEMAKAIPNEGGLWQLLAGNNNIAKFGEEIPKLGEGIKGFSDAVAGVVPEEIVAAAEAAKSLADLADAIPNEGGLWQLLAGNNNIGKFGTDLPLLGQGIKGFSDAVSGVTPESVVAAAEAAKSLVEVGNELSSSGGLWQLLAGGKDIKAFADNLDDLGSGIRRFASNVQGTDPAAVTAAAEAAKTLAEVGDILDKEGGLAGLFSGKKDLKSFADNLDDLGSGIRRFASNVQGINVEGIAASAEAAKSLAEMAKAAPEDSSKLISFGENLSIFGGKIKGYFTSVVGVSKDAISSSKQVIETMKEASSLKTGNVKTTANSIESLTKALKNLANVPKNVAHDFRDTMKALGQTSSKALLEGFKNLNTDMKKIGTEAMKAFMDGIKTSTDKIKNSTIAVSKLAATGAKSSYSDFRSAGMYVAQGFADGISSNSYAAVAKAQAMANAAARAARNALDINSPSKVFYGIGKFAGIGFVNALSDYTDASYNAGSTIADSARKGLSGAISKINDLINSDIDMQPTIRPVLDLSSVESGASAISGLLGGSVGVSANVGAISTMMGRRNQNGNNAEVVSAINGLRKDLENVNHTTNVIEGITYDDGSVVHEALKTIIQAAKIERRV